MLPWSKSFASTVPHAGCSSNFGLELIHSLEACTARQFIIHCLLLCRNMIFVGFSPGSSAVTACMNPIALNLDQGPNHKL